jgi:hypothetical protein
LAFVLVLLLLVLLVLLLLMLLLPHPIMMNDVEDGLAQVHGVNNRVDMLVLPRQGYLSKEFANFKSRARARQEQFNSRLKFYDYLGGLFRHVANKHKYVFEAVCVTLQ